MKSASISAPAENYAYYAKSATVKGKLHLFGGYNDKRKIARLETCDFVELTARLNFDGYSSSAALSIENGQKG